MHPPMHEFAFLERLHAKLGDPPSFRRLPSMFFDAITIGIAQVARERSKNFGSFDQSHVGFRLSSPNAAMLKATLWI